MYAKMALVIKTWGDDGLGMRGTQGKRVNAPRLEQEEYCIVYLAKDEGDALSEKRGQRKYSWRSWVHNGLRNVSRQNEGGKRMKFP